MVNLKSEVEMLKKERTLPVVASSKSHPGRILAIANGKGISRSDGVQILWSSSVNGIGYTWANFRQCWNKPLKDVFGTSKSDVPDDVAKWSCCQGQFDSPPCSE